jgi:glycosyltransferase involved in cell wall biosynthesis
VEDTTASPRSTGSRPIGSFLSTSATTTPPRTCRSATLTGFLVDDIDSAAAAVAAAGDLDRRRIAERAADRFTVATMIDKYVKVYRDVIANRK